MSEPASPNDEPKGTIRRVLTDLSPPKSAHLVSWTRAGTNILLEVGYFDLHSVHVQAQPDYDGERVLEWFITDRFVLDLESAARMAESFGQLAEHLAQLNNESGADDNAE